MASGIEPAENKSSTLLDKPVSTKAGRLTVKAVDASPRRVATSLRTVSHSQFLLLPRIMAQEYLQLSCLFTSSRDDFFDIKRARRGRAAGL